MRTSLPRPLSPLFIVLAMSIVSSACVPLADVDAPSRAQLRDVLTPPPEVSAAMLAEPEASLLATTAEMRQLVRAVVPAEGSTEQKLDALFKTLRYNADYAVRYDADATLTADEAFRERRANCLAFSAMFIAMAREAGLEANFQEVSVPPSWDSQRDNTLVQYRHVNVSVPLNRRVTGVIDFRIDRYSETFPKHLLSDSGALAHYHSNISMERMVNGQLAEAYVSAKRAIEADDGQSAIWNNMGIIQGRLGNLPLAEASYRQALAVNPKDWSALNNLSNIYAERGDREEAARLRELGDLIKLRNPYYRYALAQHAYRRSAYDEALAQLDSAVAKKRDEPRFYYLRGLAQWQLGDSDAARRDMKQAIEIAQESSTLALYQRQLQEWQDSNG